jgi:hypothetical protein
VIKLTIKKQIDCQHFNNKMSKGLVDFSIRLGESGELCSSAVLALIANMRESIVLDFEEWCSNGVFNIKRSEPRTSLQLIFTKYDSLFFLKLYLEVRR